ncbi:MAG: amidophosphoribosyltransferase [Planctomycetes bacterium]|nr:amidophosphoribosyltransferase [Planctomycetota bacterium]
MGDELHHECGVAALYWLDTPVGRGGAAEALVRKGDVTPLMPTVLQDIQNRGQLAAGMTSFNPQRPQLIDTYKEIGTVAEAFRMNHSGKHRAILSEYAGKAAIGHVRYATCGQEDTSYAQPFERHHGRRWKWFSFAFNGNIANFAERKRALLRKQDYHIIRDGDTEIIMHALSYASRGDRRPNLVSMVRSLSDQFDGAYNIVFLNARGDMFVARDPLGFRPLSYAVEGRLFAAASESVALRNLGFTEVHDVEPGTMVVIEDGKLSIRRFAPSPCHAHCFFEWIYFANVASTMDGSSTYLCRARLGQRLAEREDQPTDSDDCVVVPVPDTAKAAADSMAYHLGVPSMEGLIRNRYVGRTFIEGAGGRLQKVRMKYTPIPAVLSGRRIFLVEDSLVRATTMRALVERLRQEGKAREIHVRIACPPIIAPCFYGIDMSTLGELFAPKYINGGYRGRLSDAVAAKMARDLGVDSLRYLTVDDLADCLQIDHDHLCTGCVTGKYPTRWGNRLLAKAREAARDGKAGRTYE